MELTQVVVLITLLHSCVCENTTLDREIALHKALFENYNTDIIPKLNKTDPMMVDMEFYLMAIDNVDEVRQTLSVRAFLSVMWKDELLMWDTEQYPGVTSVNVKIGDIWVPDLSLDRTLDKLLDIGQEDGRAMINNEGMVTMWPYKMYTVACKISVVKFPKDKQSCDFDFLSWTNPIRVIRLTNPSGRINTNYMTVSGEWDAVGVDTTLRQSIFGPDQWDHLTFHLHLQRKWLFHALNTMAPVVCISFLNVLCFLLPAPSGERITLCISIFLTLAVFLTVINDSMPESSEDVAVFGLYVGLQLIGSALTICCTVFSLYLYHRNESKPVSLVFRMLTKLCRISPGSGYFVEISNGAIHDKLENGHITENGQIAANGHIQENGHIQDNGHFQENEQIPGKTNTIENTVKSNKRVTWVLVSIAMDRMCLVSAIFWHVILFVYLMIELNT